MVFLLILTTTLMCVLFFSFLHVKATKEKAMSIVVRGIPMVPNPHWIFGHIRMLRGDGDFRRGQYDVTLKHADSYGVCSFWFMHKPTVSVILGKDVKAALNSSSFRKEVAFLANHNDHFLGPKSLASLVGKEWKLYRAAVSRAFTPASLQGYQTAINCVGNTLVGSLKKAINRSIQVEIFEAILPIMKMATMDVFGQTAFGVDMKCCAHLKPSPIAISFEFLSDEHTRRIRRPLDIAANLYWLPTPTNRRHARESAFVRSFITDLVLERRNELLCEKNVSKKKDLLSHLLDATGQSWRTGNNSECINLSGDALADTLVLMFFAGYDTTSITLTYALYLLATHPEIEELCVAEVKSVLSMGGCSGGQFCLDSPEALPYTNAVIMEALRLYPPVIMTSRDLEQSLELHGVTIPAGTGLIIPIWTVQHDERNFPRPDEFIPERWVKATKDGGWDERYPGDEGDVTIAKIPAANRDAFCAFSGGARSCVGRKLAMREATSLLAFLVKDLKFEVAPEYTLVPQVTSFMQEPAKGLPMVIKHR